jgi:hypothetical protein
LISIPFIVLDPVNANSGKAQKTSEFWIESFSELTQNSLSKLKAMAVILKIRNQRKVDQKNRRLLLSLIENIQFIIISSLNRKR